MKTTARNIFLACALFCLGAGGGYAQQNDNSLGDIARKLNAQKAKEPKPAMVITNDNIPSAQGSTEPTVSDTKGKAGAKKTTPGKPEPGAHDEKYFRDKLSLLQDNLSTHKRELDVLQQKLGQNQTQFYPDPNKALHQEYTRGDIDKLTADIDAKKQQIAADEKAIDDLHDELRHDNGDPAWLR